MWLSLLTFLSRSKAEAKSVDPLVPSPQPLCSVVKDTLDYHFFDLGSGGKTAVMETRRDAQLRSERREKEDKDPTRGSGVMPGAVGTDAKMGIELLSSSLNKPTINQYIGVVGGEHSYLERQEREKKDAEELYARLQRRQLLEVKKAWLEVDRLQIEIEDLERAQRHFPISYGARCRVELPRLRTALRMAEEWAMQYEVLAADKKDQPDKDPQRLGDSEGEVPGAANAGTLQEHDGAESMMPDTTPWPQDGKDDREHKSAAAAVFDEPPSGLKGTWMEMPTDVDPQQDAEEFYEDLQLRHLFEAEKARLEAKGLQMRIDDLEERKQRKPMLYGAGCLVELPRLRDALRGAETRAKQHEALAADNGQRLAMARLASPPTAPSSPVKSEMDQRSGSWPRQIASSDRGKEAASPSLLRASWTTIYCTLCDAVGKLKRCNQCKSESYCSSGHLVHWEVHLHACMARIGEEVSPDRPNEQEYDFDDESEEEVLSAIPDGDPGRRRQRKDREGEAAEEVNDDDDEEEDGEEEEEEKEEEEEEEENSDSDNDSVEEHGKDIAEAQRQLNGAAVVGEQSIVLQVEMEQVLQTGNFVIGCESKATQREGTSFGAVPQGVGASSRLEFCRRKDQMAKEHCVSKLKQKARVERAHVESTAIRQTARYSGLRRARMTTWLDHCVVRKILGRVVNIIHD